MFTEPSIDFLCSYKYKNLLNCLKAWLIIINFIRNVAINKRICLTAWRHG